MLLDALIANSLFTSKQIAIISKRLGGKGKAQNMTGGAYYRQVSQCRDKAIATLYSMLILQLIGAIQPNTADAIAKVAEQLRVMFASENRDVLLKARSDDVMSVIDQVIKRVCNL